MFKLKKASKKVGDFDVTDEKTEWIMLERQEIGDMPSFVHLQRLWVREETEDVFDSEGNIVTRGLKKESSLRFYKGFIKDGKYIVEYNSLIPFGTDHEAQKKLITRLENLLQDSYKMVESDGKTPTYYKNERESMTPPDTQGMMNALAQSITSSPQSKVSTPLIKVLPLKKNQNP